MTASPKTTSFKRWALAVFVAAALSVATPSLSRADDSSAPDHDARLDGYAQNMALDAGGTASTYIVLCLIGALGLGVLFISGKRTHLD